MTKNIAFAIFIDLLAVGYKWINYYARRSTQGA